MSPPKSRFSCWSCGVTATHRTLTTTPKHITNPPGEWMCFHCIGQHNRKRNE